MAPFVIVEHFPPFRSVSPSSSPITSKTKKLGLRHKTTGSPTSSSNSSSEQTTATIVSLEEASYDKLIEETVEVIHKHSSETAQPTTVITTSSVLSVMALQLDRYGFIVNIDSNGQVQETHGDEAIRVPTFAEAQRTERREQKWNDALKHWDPKKKQQVSLPTRYNKKKETQKQLPLYQSPSLAAAPLPSKVALRRLRKGIPDSVRGKVWAALGGGIQKPGLYQEIVYKTSDAMLENYREMKERHGARSTFQDPLGLSTPSEFPIQEEANSNRTSPTSASTDLSSTTPPGVTLKQKKTVQAAKNEDENSAQDYAATRGFRTIQDIIERDIHRTFPRHNLFYEEERHRAVADERTLPPTSSSPTNLITSGLCDPQLASLILNLETDIRMASAGDTSAPITDFGDNGPSAVTTPGGQAALRRVLRAYSYYDSEVGYCQGMNFIAGMFLTVMSEEEAFWLLVVVMNDYPCKMRGMFGEGMKETHKVLYIGEKLIHHYLPRLARHLDKEHIHVTMFATQWLLTQYTSSFRFDLVFRVWDCFLGEGWKIIYRVMLALLQKYQSQLLKMSFEEILTFFRELPDKVEGYQIMEIALKIPLRRKVIARYEKEWEIQNTNN
ncbi:Rab-GTPase-TBC domain containing protein [Nitzschia inconspicua]|uniref:Rab-GTPase-TBC domain containing protein n=1 Tax=Nitzschia inconspicua TaxID=303405 RepID=A0A9K3Q812_9STRA|nr:Rab-GTPase-TBC domain containing protein [Nitzschia inconspicua]